MSSRWAVYLKERFPLIPNLLAAWGMILSCARLALPPGTPTPHLEFSFGLIGGLIFLAQLRFMDELKDFEKDKIAHPDRPLPRGLFSTTEFARWISIFQGLMLGLSILTAVFLNLAAGIFFAVGTAYLYLMYREFFLGPKLATSPILYAITHQMITVPMLAFGFAVFSPNSWMTSDFAWYAALLVSAFFVFEIGRKLDPNAHPLLSTYLTVYGKAKTALMMIALMIILLISAHSLGLGKVLFPLGGVSLISFILIWAAPNRFKWVEGILTLLLLASLWTLPFLERS